MPSGRCRGAVGKEEAHAAPESEEGIGDLLAIELQQKARIEVLDFVREAAGERLHQQLGCHADGQKSAGHGPGTGADDRPDMFQEALADQIVQADQGAGFEGNAQRAASRQQQRDRFTPTFGLLRPHSVPG